MSGLISVLGLVTAVATAITSQVTVINPRVGAWVMLAGMIASAVGGAVNKRISLGPVATFVGVIAAVAGILAQATNVIRPSFAQVIAVIGTAGTAAGVSLFGWETKSKNGGGSGLTMSLGYIPPSEDRPSIRSPKRVVRVYNRALVCPLIFALAFQACSQKTTLDRIGTITLTAVNAYLIEINQLHSGGNLSNEKYSALKSNGDLAKERAEEFARQLQAFGEITPDNVSGLTQQVASLTGFLQQLLRDAGLDPRSKPVRILSFAIDTLNAGSIVIAGIHPAPVVAANRNTGVLRPNPRPESVNISIPKPDREVAKALDAARLANTSKPSKYKETPVRTTVDFRLQTSPN